MENACRPGVRWPATAFVRNEEGRMRNEKTDIQDRRQEAQKAQKHNSFFVRFVPLCGKYSGIPVLARSQNPRSPVLTPRARALSRQVRG